MRDDGNGVLLDGGGLGVVTLLDATGGRLEEPAILEPGDVRRRIAPCHFHGYLVVFVKVDSCVYRGKEAVLILGWCWRNVELALGSYEGRGKR